jgi:hypothetical protein
MRNASSHTGEVSCAVRLVERDALRRRGAFAGAGILRSLANPASNRRMPCRRFAGSRSSRILRSALHWTRWIGSRGQAIVESDGEKARVERLALEDVDQLEDRPQPNSPTEARILKDQTRRLTRESASCAPASDQPSRSDEPQSAAGGVSEGAAGGGGATFLRLTTVFFAGAFFAAAFFGAALRAVFLTALFFTAFFAATFFAGFFAATLLTAFFAGFFAAAFLAGFFAAAFAMDDDPSRLAPSRARKNRAKIYASENVNFVFAPRKPTRAFVGASSRFVIE